MILMQSQTIELRNDLRDIAMLSAWIDRFADEARLSAAKRGELQVALEEVAINVIKHGYGEQVDRRFTITLSSDEEGVTAEVIDEAMAYNPLEQPAIDTDLPLESRQIGGLGVHMVKQLMSSVSYERRDGRNVLTLYSGRSNDAGLDRDIRRAG